MAADKQQVIQDLDEIIGLIGKDTKDITKDEKKKMVSDTLNYFDNYVSPGWLKYRKSVSSDSENGAVLEWYDEGAYVYGLNDEKFIDCLGGFGIYTCGHRNPEIMEVVREQLNHQALHSQELLDPLRGYLAKAVADITPGDLQQCFFTNGGAEAVEMALKLARIATGGRWYISTVGAFHGKSMGAISVGGKSTYRVPYTPMVQQVQHVRYGVAEDIRKAIENLQAVGEPVAAVILEPIQGEAGVIIPPDGYLTEVRKICDDTGVALIFDEIQTGMGRTGTMWRWAAASFRSPASSAVPRCGCRILSTTRGSSAPRPLAATRCAAPQPLPPSGTCSRTTSRAYAGEKAKSSRPAFSPWQTSTRTSSRRSAAPASCSPWSSTPASWAMRPRRGCSHGRS